MADEKSGQNLWDQLLRLRDEDRARRANSLMLIKGKNLPLEINRQGNMRWFMHPLKGDTCIKNMIIYSLEIPAGSKSGKVKYQGGQVIYVWKGRGHSVLDGVRHPWKAGDVVQLPLRPLGVTYQHFNDDPDRAAVLICVEPNTVDALGLDRGSGFEQLEDCPEYRNLFHKKNDKEADL